MNTIEFHIPAGMEKETALFYDCCNFWQRMGVQKEDNIIAFSLADLILVCKKDFMLKEWEDHYKVVFEKAIEEIKKPIYNENRGRNNFLANSGL